MFKCRGKFLTFTFLDSEKMFRTLVSEVGVVFHSAATIRFDEKMTEVGETHLLYLSLGSRQIILLVKVI